MKTRIGTYKPYVTVFLVGVFAVGCGRGLRGEADTSADDLLGGIELQENQILIDDMILEKVQGIQKRGTLSAQDSAFEFYSVDPWPEGILPVAFDSSTSPTKQELFWDACRSWVAYAGVRCVLRTNETVYTIVYDRPSCSSNVGRPRSGLAQINIGGCSSRKGIVHELGHAFGLIHEHQRSDRDSYIEVRRENAIDQVNFDKNFGIIPTSRITGEYDFNSIMHYHTLNGALSANQPVIVPRPEYSHFTFTMGTAAEPSELDRRSLANFYNKSSGTTPYASNALPQFSRGDFYSAMLDLNAVYIGELHRGEGLTLDGGPDFLGIAAWIFDIYLSTLASGYSPADSFFNVRAWISNSDEWKGKNPGKASLTPLPTRSPINLDRAEYLDAMRKLDQAYKTELLRPNGLRIGNTPDFLGIAAWIFDIYLNAKIRGLSKDGAWEEVLKNIRASEEYKSKH